jgi:hypothetical protein
MALMKKPGKNDSMPKRIRQRAMNMAMADRGGAAMPPTMSSAPMAPPPGMASPMSAPPAMKKGGAVKEKSSGERYASKAAMKKHESGESKATERKEHKMRGGGIAVKGKGVALRGGGVATRGMGVALKKGGEAKRPGLMVMIAVGKGKKK